MRATSAFNSASRFFMRSYLIALCFDAFALIFVPSSATWPSLTSPAVSHNFRTCRNSAPSAFKCRLRKSLIVRKSGGSSATIIAHIAAHDLLEIKVPHQLNDKPRDMAFRHEVLHIRRQQQCLIDIPGAKILAHSPRLNQTRSELNSDYSDRLLVLLSQKVAGDN